MPKLLPAEETLRDLLALGPSTEDPASEVRQILESADSGAIRLVQLGARLKEQAVRDRQALGISAAQKVKKKYPGRKPQTFKMGGKKLDMLRNTIENYHREDKDVNLSEVAKQLRISRSTLYRYLEASPGLLGALQKMRLAKGQHQRQDQEKAEKSLQVAAYRLEKALKDSGQSRSNRPVYEAASAERKARRGR